MKAFEGCFLNPFLFIRYRAKQHFSMCRESTEHQRAPGALHSAQLSAFNKCFSQQLLNCYPCQEEPFTDIEHCI